MQSFLFPQNLKLENTFLVSRYSHQIRSLLDLVTPNNKQTHIPQTSTLNNDLNLLFDNWYKLKLWAGAESIQISPKFRSWANELAAT